MQDALNGKQEILEQLDELLNIPQIERILYHKIEELKQYFEEEIDRYKGVKENFRKFVYGDMQVLDPQQKTQYKSKTYLFELYRTNNGEWTATWIEPSPPPGFLIFDIIPEEIVEYIGTFRTAPEKVETRKGLSLPGLEGNAFDLSFTKYSDWHALGTIRGYKLPLNGEDEELPDHMTEIYNYDNKETDSGNYNELIFFMQKYPELKWYFLTEFNMKMKPLITGNLVDFTVSSHPVDLF